MAYRSSFDDEGSKGEGGSEEFGEHGEKCGCWDEREWERRWKVDRKARMKLKVVVDGERGGLGMYALYISEGKNEYRATLDELRGKRKRRKEEE